jgi:Sec-independent protein secretion pathway component TatC
MARYRAPKFDEHLTLVEHLDELRTRLIVSIAALVVASSTSRTSRCRGTWCRSPSASPSRS